MTKRNERGHKQVVKSKGHLLGPLFATIPLPPPVECLPINDKILRLDSHKTAGQVEGSVHFLEGKKKRDTATKKRIKWII
ncbi:hypothetical protein TNIN_174221 [Trichonephila inaurata madagascariensis]|uniref:Uncharacterized protein n=1 Tax=Trichonephila inaurata madagascariensis TaxID=2747483 RepID=A0A8X6WW94_9ARAC|nr:hypothetical protein TNIN_174221 [Trichonephila inaurata madagascariensis]